MIKAALRFLPQMNKLAFSLFACVLGGCATIPPAPVAKAEPAPCLPAAPCTTPLPVKVVIVTMFEIGADEGDAPGEFQLWKERRAFTQKIAFPQGYHDLYYNPADQTLLMVTGMGTARSTGSVMALGLDQRFDLSKSYWLVAGIAGGDPNDTSIGSAAWAHYVVDGDLAHEIDAREIPKGWPTGYFARRTQFPYDPHMTPSEGEVFEANPKLRDWAYDLTKDIKLADVPGLVGERSKYKGYPNALKPPSIQKGDTLQSMTYWHGTLLNEWANRWVPYWSGGKGEFVTSAMEDTGTMQALTWLTHAGRADVSRAMVLRAVSNYTMQPPGETAAQHLLSERKGYSGMRTSLETLYVAGSKVVDELTAHWDLYKDATPGH